MRLGIVAAVAVAVLGFAAEAQPASAPDVTKTPSPALAAFFDPPTFDDAVLSPDGAYMAYTQVTPDDFHVDTYTSVVFVENIAEGTRVAIFKSTTKGANVGWLSWKDNNRLLIDVNVLDIQREGNRPDGDFINARFGNFILATDRDGKNQVQMLKTQSADRERSSLVSLVDRLRGDPDHILIEALNHSYSPAIWRVDVHTGEAVDIEDGTDEVSGWLTDDAGQPSVRFREVYKTQFIEVRAKGETKWTVIAAIRRTDGESAQDFQFLGPTTKPGEFYVTTKPKSAADGEFRRLRTYDVRTKTLGGPAWGPLDPDIEGIVYDRDSHRLDGVCYTQDVEVCDFSDKPTNAYYRALVKFFDGDRSVRAGSISLTGRYWLLDVSGPDQPGGYYLFDRTAKHIDPLGDRYAQLPSDSLATMQRFHFKARDGADVPGYITRPKAAAPGPLPLIVMPHGGPEARDMFGYNPWAQVLATRGYMVFQPNFRGSEGYGVSYAKAGYKQWSGVMANDITDGVKALIASGKVDPSRVCIFGASYGGYAALFAGATHPELYKCVVSRAGLADLAATMRFERTTYKPDSERYKYWLKSIGDPDKDTAMLAAASPVTYAASYGPPVLLLHGENDWNVDPNQSQIMYHALKRSGRSVQLLTYKHEGHSGWQRQDEIAATTEIVKFIEAHIAPAPLTAPPPAR